MYTSKWILNTYVISIAFSFICSMVGWPMRYPQRYKFFSVLLCLTLLLETQTLKVLPVIHIRSGGRNAIYNIFSLVEFLFYAMFFYNVTRIGWMKKLQAGFLILFPVAWLWMVSAGKGIVAFHGSVTASGGVFIVCFALCYLYILSGEVHSKAIWKIPEFWISLGLILFYCCQAPYMGSLNWLGTYHLDLARRLINVSLLINTIMYCLFGYAFICLRKNYSSL